jgi:nondiscriminating aspartyl-tRNA synthetase
MILCMEKRILSSQLKEYINKKVKLSGWLYKKRSLGGMTFLVLRDRHGLVQVLDEKSEESKKLDGLQNGTILRIEGLAVADDRAPSGVEIHEPKIIVDVPVIAVPPIEIDKPIDHTPNNLDTLFENRVANMRNLTEQGIWKIQMGVGDGLREYLKSHDFTEFHSPKLLAEATEGGAEVFELDYFGKKSTLAQSAQFYKQIMVGAYERVFEIGATYRAEPSMTTRHMSEFTTVDVEMGFIDSFQDVLNLLSGAVNHVVNSVWEKYEKELIALKAEKPQLTEKFPEITMKDLHELYLKETGEDLRKEIDPTPAEERFISEYSAKNWGSEAVYITEFPSSHMKFYHHKSEENPEVVDRADLIFRGVEIVTVTRRENRFEKLVEQLKAIGGDPNHPGFKYYLEAFKYGLPAHGGFGLGLERLTQRIIGLNSVKEATLFPRDVNRLTP